VSVDGRALGECPATTILDIGPHTAVFTWKFLPFKEERSFTLGKGERATIQARGERLGTLALDGLPEYAQVWVDAALIPERQERLALEAGTHSVEIYGSIAMPKKSVVIVAGKTTAIPVVGKNSLVPMFIVGAGSFRRESSDVKLSSFLIGVHEVTQEEFQTVVGSNPSNFKSGKRPVEQVSWYDAVAFCNRLSEMEGFSKVYTINGTNVTVDLSRNGYRLPTEAEWEYAARGGNGSPGGYKYSGSNDVGAVAWYDGNSSSTTQDVGTKAANGLGLYDMSGNVLEWCHDWYGSYGSGSQSDPTGASSGAYRVGRGGGWYSGAGDCRSAARGSIGPDNRYEDIGFRVLRRP
jgi:hypothetical protein